MTAVRTARLRCLALVALAIAVCWPAMVWSGSGGSGLPAGAAPVVVGLVVVAALSVLVGMFGHEILGSSSGRLAGDALFQSLSPARQCDPDAPGRARPRAPGAAARF